MDNPTDDTAGAARERYADLQYVFVQFLTEHLIDCRAEFGGDLDAVLLLALIGQNHIKAYMAGETDPSAPGSPFAITASRLADVSQMSRETVRRKLAVMEKRGWVARNADSSWALAGRPEATEARRALGDLDQRGMARAMRLHGDFGRILGRLPSVRKVPKMST